MALSDIDKLPKLTADPPLGVLPKPVMVAHLAGVSYKGGGGGSLHVLARVDTSQECKEPHIWYDKKAEWDDDEERFFAHDGQSLKWIARSEITDYTIREAFEPLPDSKAAP